MDRRYFIRNCFLTSLFLDSACKNDSIADLDKPDDDDDIVLEKAGRVLCDEQGIPGVVVTDGTNFTVTDNNGAYLLPYNPTTDHIYISSPAGYTVPVENSVPKFWIRLTDISDKKNINFELKRMSVPDTKHYFIAVGDPQVRNTTEISKLKPILDHITQDIIAFGMNPVHLMVTGDIVFNKPGMHDQSKACFSTVNQPVYYAIGNHDHTFDTNQTVTTNNDKTADTVYIDHYGPTCYSFNRGEVHYLVLDNIYFEGGADAEYTVNFTPEQLKWAMKDLTYVAKSKAIVVMIHGPSKSRASSVYGNSADLHALLKSYANVQIISGHTHYNYTYVDNSVISEHNIGAACGGFWEGPVCLDGTKLGYKIFEVDGINFKWTYRAYADPESQFSIFNPENRASELRPAEELLVNVWDWDPEWSVKWSEDGGDTFREMTRITKTYDPEAYSYFGLKGDSTIPGRTWIGASLTDHIFQCIPSINTKQVIVKVINRFGTEFRKITDL